MVKSFIHSIIVHSSMYFPSFLWSCAIIQLVYSITKGIIWFLFDKFFHEFLNIFKFLKLFTRQVILHGTKQMIADKKSGGYIVCGRTSHTTVYYCVTLAIRRWVLSCNKTINWILWLEIVLYFSTSF